MWVAGGADEPGQKMGGERVSKPLVSVLIPVYNHVQFIHQCLDSLVEDGWENLEVLVVDDGSTDDSYEVAKSWVREHPTAFTRIELSKQTNQGLTRTLNHLVNIAQGEFIALLASDDMLMPGGVAARVKALQEHPDWLAVFGDCTVIDDDSKEIYQSGIEQLWARPARKHVLLDHVLRPYEIAFRWTIPGPIFMLKKETFAQIGGYDEELSVEDRDFYLRLALRNRLGFINVRVAKYRFHTNNSYKDPERVSMAYRDMALSVSRNRYLTGGYLRFTLFVDGLNNWARYKFRKATGLQQKIWWIWGLGLRILWRLLDLGYEVYRLMRARRVTELRTGLSEQKT